MGEWGISLNIMYYVFKEKPSAVKVCPMGDGFSLGIIC